jgi:maltose phosphorylase
MKQYIKQHEWEIIEEGFNPHYNKISESIFSIGNGRMGQRANFEEVYSGETLQGSYVAGVYYPDKTRVGWWKNGYPEYFAKVLNAPNWIGIHVSIDHEVLDLARCEVSNFRRVLDMKRGLLIRSFVAALPSGKKVEVQSQRFCSMSRTEVGAIRYSIRPLNFSGVAVVDLFVDGDVINKDSNYDEKFWDEIHTYAADHEAVIVTETRKTRFHVCTRMTYTIESATGKDVVKGMTRVQRTKFAGNRVDVQLDEGKAVTITKYASVLSSENHPKEELVDKSKEVLSSAVAAGFDSLLAEHEAVWAHKWSEADITIEGDIAAQQGIRFNIFQLTQTYTGEDERLNIGPKGFTGEKYGGSTYWDTEAYCLPFFLSTADQRVARNLLVYRYKHLERALENAMKLGFHNGAALYPMVTMNGEECHNEWEITFEEIHRNGAIAYAIYDYIRYTGDETYLIEYGLEVLIAISRFWAQRVNWSESKQRYVMLGVTGPNEYENNVNNNWYTNYIANWTLQYTIDSIRAVRQTAPGQYNALVSRIKFSEAEEVSKWGHIIEHMYFPEDDTRGVFLQQDGFLDKELKTVAALKPEDRPINQKWSWDRILRSCYIKQADVLQGLYFFEDQFTLEQIRRNFDFYEPMTVHESSLSPCVHVILASRLGYKTKAYELYLRTARLDLDDYNNDTEDGCHITSMAGTWMSVVKGFGGMRVENGYLKFDPFIPEQWKSYSFTIEFRGRVLRLKMSKEEVQATLELGDPIEIKVRNQMILVTRGTVVHELTLHD